MTATLDRVETRPARPPDGGQPARRAVVRWAWRLFRREWRQQLLVLVLLTVAVAATTIGVAVVSTAAQSPDSQFGTANTDLIISGADPDLRADLTAAQQAFGKTDVIEHLRIAVPGSVSSVDLRAENPKGLYTRGMLRLDQGRLPSGPGQVAVTSAVAATFGLHLGGTWQQDGQTLSVVGIVENPLNLLDDFALVAPGQISAPTEVDIYVDASNQAGQNFRFPSGTGLNISTQGVGNRNLQALFILILASIGLLFVGLVAVAGFTVMAQRRLRAIGMLGAIGATDRHIRLVMIANGAAVGSASAVAGAGVGLAAWFAFAPILENVAEQRVDRFNLPWWAVIAAMLLAVVTSVAAAWWPARAAAGTPVVSALSGRPPAPQPAHRSALVGLAVIAAGGASLILSDQHKTAFVIVGVIATAVGILLLAPLTIKALAALAGRTHVAVRLALRDLARYQARSGAALGAVTLAIGIAATIAVSAASVQKPATAGNLPSNQLNIYLTQPGAGPETLFSAAQIQNLQSQVDQLAQSLHAKVVIPLDVAATPGDNINQSGGNGQAQVIPAQIDQVDLSKNFSIEYIAQPYVASPALLAHFGIKPSAIQPDADIVTSLSDLSLDKLVSAFAAANGPAPVGNPSASAGSPGLSGSSSHSRAGPDLGKPTIKTPTFQVIKGLTAYTSAPDVLITAHALTTLGLQAIPAGWIIQTSGSLSKAQIDAAQSLAAKAGMYTETRSSQKSLGELKDWSTTVGILVALGVLAMTVGLIRSETANDLRTLTATGASAITRRALTGATAAALALLGAGLGTVDAYIGLMAWHHRNLKPLGHVPVTNLIVIVVGLPLVALVGGWLLAGREPRAIARKPLE